MDPTLQAPSPYANQATSALTPLQAMQLALQKASTAYGGGNQSPEGTSQAGNQNSFGATPNYGQFAKDTIGGLAKGLGFGGQSSTPPGTPSTLSTGPGSSPSGPTLSNGNPANTYEGSIGTPANPFDPSTGQFGMPSASMTDPSGGMTGNIPLPQPNPSGAFSGAAAPGAGAFNPAAVDPMTAALMANGGQAAPDALASAAPDALSSLFL